MTFRIDFHVEGNPVPQGSTRAFKTKSGKVVTTNDPTGSIERWRGDIRTEAKKLLAPSFECLTGPVWLRTIFTFARPKSHYLPANSKRREPVLRPDAPMFHTQSPDADKLLRAVLDALTAVVYRDDAQVMPSAMKVWGATPMAVVRVRELVEGDL